MSKWFYIRHREGFDPKEIGPFETGAKARKYIARSIVDNGHGEKSEAIKFARSIPAQGVRGFKPGLQFEVVRRD